MQHLLSGANWTDINFAGKKNNKRWSSWDNKLNPQQCKLKAMKVYCMVGYISKSIVSSTKKMLVSLSLALVIPPCIVSSIGFPIQESNDTEETVKQRNIKMGAYMGFYVCLFVSQEIIKSMLLGN